jgi:hypothetical protein
VAGTTSAEARATLGLASYFVALGVAELVGQTSIDIARWLILVPMALAVSRTSIGHMLYGIPTIVLFVSSAPWPLAARAVLAAMFCGVATLAVVRFFRTRKGVEGARPSDTA